MNGKAAVSPYDLKSVAVLSLMVSAAVAGSFIMARSPLETAAVAGAAGLAVFFAVRHPEVLFVLFLMAGTYKSDPRFQLPGVDMTVVLGLLTCLGLLWGFRTGRIKLSMPPRKMYLPYMAILWLCALSLMYTAAPMYGGDKLSRLATITLFSLVAPYYLLQDKGRLRNFCAAYVMVALVMLADVLGKAGMDTRSEGALSAFGSDYMTLGYVLGAAFILVFLFFLQTDKSLIRRAVYVLALCPAIVYGLLLSGARGPLISLGLTLAALPFLARRPHAGSFRLAKWTAAALAAGAGYLYFNLHEFARMSERLGVLGEGGGSSALERVSLAKAALSAMSSMPNIITGLGVGGFGVYYLGFDDIRSAYPHNVILEVGAELGITGIAAIVLLLYWSYKTARGILRKAKGPGYFFGATALAFFSFMLLNALKSGDINDNRLLFTSMGMIYALDRGTEDETKG